MRRALLHLLLIPCLGWHCGRDWASPAVWTGATPATSNASPPTAAPTPPMTLAALPIGQGTAVLVRTPLGRTILVDGGPPGSAASVIDPWLTAEGWPAPSIILASHYDLDHIGGALEWLAGRDAVPATEDDRIPADGCWDRGDQPVMPEPWTDFLVAARQQCGRTLQAGATIAIDDVTLTVTMVNGQLGPDPPALPIDPEDENAHSAVLQLAYGDFRAALMGDLPGGGGVPPYDTIDLESIVAPRLGDVDVLIVGHHGSRTSTNATLLATTRPEVAIIPVGADNPYGHPHREVLDRLSAAGITTYTTRDGPVVVHTDGRTYSVSE